MRRLLVLFSLVALSFLPAIVAVAQSASSATITGQVLDPQGAVIAGAKITATHLATGGSYRGLIRPPKTTASGQRRKASA